MKSILYFLLGLLLFSSSSFATGWTTINGITPVSINGIAVASNISFNGIMCGLASGAQYFLPGYGMFNDQGASRSYMIPGFGFVSE